MPSLSLTLHSGIERALGRSLTWRLGRWLYLGSRRELINDPRLNGEYALQGWLLRAARRRGPDQRLVFVDVGANLGDWAAQLLQAIQRDGLPCPVALHAFEPAPAQRSALAMRLAPFLEMAAVEVDARGLAADCGAARLILEGDQAGSNALATDDDVLVGNVVDIDVTTLDQVCLERGYEHLFFVKVDTEGNDFNVIQGARGLFEVESISALQFEYNWRWVHFGHTLRDVFRLFENSKYLISKITPDRIEIYDRWHPEIERYLETNYLILHRDLVPDIPSWQAAFDRFNALPGAPSGRSSRAEAAPASGGGR